MIEVVVIGGGGHGREIAAILEGMDNVSILGVAADKKPSKFRYPWLGTTAQALSDVADHVRFIVAIGNNFARKRIQNEWQSAGKRPLIAIAGDVSLHETVTIGEGAQLCLGVTMTCDIDIGAGAIVNTRAVLSHDCAIGDYSFIGPGAVLCGQVTIGNNATIGSGATLLPGVTIEDNAVIGAGACVVKNVSKGQTVVGVPARVKPGETT